MSWLHRWRAIVSTRMTRKRLSAVDPCLLSTAESQSLAMMIGEALDICRCAEPRTAYELQEILGICAANSTVVRVAEQDWAMTALRMFVAVALEIDDAHLGAVLACIRYLKIRADLEAAHPRAVH